MKPSRAPLVPVAGIAIFLALYVTAALLYPGGYHEMPSAQGFSVVHNYWCDLLDPRGYNGARNPGRPIGIAAMFCLALSLGVFWTLLPRLYPENRRARFLTRGGGHLSSTIMAFIFLPQHDRVIDAAGLFGVLAFTTATLALRARGERRLVALAAVVLAVVAVNFLIWKTGIALAALPLIQKAAFLLFFAWVAAASLRLRSAASIPNGMDPPDSLTRKNGRGW